MAAGEHNFTIEQGAKWDVTITVADDGTPRVWTFHTARMQIRPTVESSTILAELNTEGDGDGTITLTNPGIMNLVLPTTVTEYLNFQTARYDLEATISEETERLLMGNVTLSKEITRVDSS
jgi:hypothetical protein